MLLNEQRNAIYQQCREDLLKRQLSNSEHFDKSVLSLSSAGLGFSLAFMKDIIPVAIAHNLILLHLSWGCFAAAIVSTLVSFLVSQKAIDCQLEYAERYYLKKEEEFLNKKNLWGLANNWLGRFSAFVFIIAVICTIMFVMSNPVGGKKMEEKKTVGTIIMEGATVPGMVRVPGDLNNGQPIPTLQPLPSTTSSGPPKGDQAAGGDSASDGSVTGK